MYSMRVACDKKEVSEYWTERSAFGTCDRRLRIWSKDTRSSDPYS